MSEPMTPIKLSDLDDLDVLTPAEASKVIGGKSIKTKQKIRNRNMNKAGQQGGKDSAGMSSCGKLILASSARSKTATTVKQNSIPDRA